MQNLTLGLVAATAFVLLLAPEKGVEGLSCPFCNKAECKNIGLCPAGVTMDVCGCCPVCSKGPGEKCGGPWGILGKCGTGLTCSANQRLDVNADGICERADGQEEGRRFGHSNRFYNRNRFRGI
ncbi:unnamed protein product [Cyprideis torosa]|uniref:Uncharacterized protein n=1 Tax=Cyprideis torosa TaxID=163714 RepID=A0A7R8ZMZ2_9CRUS|nr:unnamed protein product [Cyprideis torosa]CAG0885442.1 unnamed protein product [Cyprideis torosa]